MGDPYVFLSLNSWICFLFVIHNILSCNKIGAICKMCRPDPFVFRDSLFTTGGTEVDKCICLIYT